MRLRWPEKRVETRLITPGVLILTAVYRLDGNPAQLTRARGRGQNSRLALEILHDVQKLVVDIGLILEL